MEYRLVSGDVDLVGESLDDILQNIFKRTWDYPEEEFVSIKDKLRHKLFYAGKFSSGRFFTIRATHKEFPPIFTDADVTDQMINALYRGDANFGMLVAK